MQSIINKYYYVSKLFEGYKAVEVYAPATAKIEDKSIDLLVVTKAPVDLLEVWCSLVEYFPNALHISITQAKYPDTHNMRIIWRYGRWFL